MSTVTRLLPLKEVLTRIGLKKSKLALLERDGLFIRKIVLCRDKRGKATVVRYHEAELEEWIRKVITEGMPQPKVQPDLTIDGKPL